MGALMTEKTNELKRKPVVPDVVALLDGVPALGLLRGQVGTVVEGLDESTVLVEFSDDQGAAYAVEPLPVLQLLVLHYVPEAA